MSSSADEPLNSDNAATDEAAALVVAPTPTTTTYETPDPNPVPNTNPLSDTLPTATD